jgi:hypothetical protein
MRTARPEGLIKLRVLLNHASLTLPENQGGMNG